MKTPSQFIHKLIAYVPMLRISGVRMPKKQATHYSYCRFSLFRRYNLQQIYLEH
jgi:hypothetical protein